MNTNEKQIIPIFFASDDNYIPFLGVAIKSLLDNASDRYFYNIHILTEGLREDNIKRIKALETPNCKIYFKDLSQNIARIKERLSAILRDYYSVSIFYRIFIATLYPEYHKAIYLDCDIVLVDDISKMYEIDIKDNILGAATDDVVYTSDVFTKYAEDGVGIYNHQYFNSGVLLMNLDAYRENKIQEKFVYLLVKYNFDTICPDQDYLNVLCKDKIFWLDKGWDRMPVGEFDGELHLIHYNNFKKPWYYDDVRYSEYFWEYARKAEDFFDEILSIKNNFTPKIAKEKEQGIINLANQAIKIYSSENNFCKVLAGKKI